MPHAGVGDARRHHRRARRRKVDHHRGPRHVPDRPGSPGRGAGRRPVVHPHRGRSWGQDPDGAAGGEPRRLHPAVADIRNPRRGRQGHPGDHRAAGGGRVRRRAGRDGGGGSVRGRRRQHGRHTSSSSPWPAPEISCRASRRVCSSRRHRGGQQRPTASTRPRPRPPPASCPPRSG